MGINAFQAGQPIRASDLNQLPVIVSYLSTGSISNSSAEAVIGTFSIPAGDPTFPGGYWWKIFGTEVASPTPTLIIRMRLGGLAGTALLNPTAASVTLAAGAFAIEGALGFATIGSSGSFLSVCTLTEGFASSAAQVPGITVSQVSINTTVANNIVVTAQWSVASTSNTAATTSGALYRL